MVLARLAHSAAKKPAHEVLAQPASPHSSRKAQLDQQMSSQSGVILGMVPARTGVTMMFATWLHTCSAEATAQTDCVSARTVVCDSSLSESACAEGGGGGAE